MRTIIEPFRIKSVDAITITTAAQRRVLELAAARVGAAGAPRRCRRDHRK